MKHIFYLIFVVTLASTSPAVAFNFGFVRVPDWMDQWIVLLLILQAPFWLVALRYKPRGQSLLQMDRSGLPGFAKFSILAVIVLFALLMIMIFVGMGLARM